MRPGQLTEVQIREIYVGWLSEEPKLAIARRLHIDNSTVHYHLRKIKDLPREHVVALITPKCSGGHTALKCLVCGKSSDNIKSEEFQTILRLRKRIRELEFELQQYAANSNHQPSSPIVRISL